MKTEALLYLGERKIEFREVELPEPEAHELLVEMEICGICGWDLLAYAGRFAKFHPYPFRAGHEGVGRVVKAGPLVQGISVGQRVACHELPIGDRGGGLMARHALRTWNKVSVIPETPDIQLKHWVVEPAACIVNGIEYSEIRPGDSVALVGAGYMGLLMLQGLRRTMAAKVSVFEPEQARLELAKRLGAGMGNWDFVLVGPSSPGAERHAMYDVVIETAGTQASLDLAFALAKPYAVIENFAWHHHKAEFDLDHWHTRGLRILNIQPQMNDAFDSIFPRAIALMAAGAISNRDLVTHVAPFPAAEEAYGAGLDKKDGYIKGVIDFTRK